MKKDSGLFLVGLALLVGGLIAGFKGKSGEAISTYDQRSSDFHAYEHSSEQTFLFGFLMIGAGVVCVYYSGVLRRRK